MTDTKPQNDLFSEEAWETEGLEECFRCGEPILPTDESSTTEKGEDIHLSCSLSENP